MKGVLNIMKIICSKANLLNDVYNKCCILLYNLKNTDLIGNSSLDLASIINNYIIDYLLLRIME